MKTKEQLIQENAELSARLKNRDDQSLTLRERFSRVLKSYPSMTTYYSSPPYSWEEIFCEIGKLLAMKRSLGMEERVLALESTSDECLKYLRNLNSAKVSDDNIGKWDTRDCT
jgi:hypothetical protein